VHCPEIEALPCSGLVLNLFLFEFQSLGTVAILDRPLTQQQAILQHWQSRYGIFIVCAVVS